MGPSRDYFTMIQEARPAAGDLFGNPVFLSAVFSLLVAQFIKAIVNLFRYRSRSLREVLATFLWKTGGMPSSHSALAVSIATAIAFTEGVNTSIFILAFFFALVVIRDAMGITMYRFADSAFAQKGQVGFLAFMRSGGVLTDTQAVKFFQHGAAA